VYTYTQKCNAIINWAADKRDFNTHVVEGVLNRLAEGGQISYSQEMAIENILDGFQISIEKNLKDDDL